MATPTLSELLDSPTRREVEAVVLALQGTTENPISDWFIGAVWRTMMKLERHVIHDLVSNALPAMAEGAYLDTTTEEWIATLARGWYEVDRAAATLARQAIVLACAAGQGPHTITAGAHAFIATDGKRYISATGGTLNGGNTLAIDVQAESPGAARGLVNALAVETVLPGVTVQSAAIDVVVGVSQYGSDEESLESVIVRCDERFPGIEDVPETDRVEDWVRAASAEITRVRLDGDPVNPGGVIVTVAGVSGAVTGGAVTAAQAYVDDRQAITDLNTVQNASNLAINVGGTAYVPAAFEAEVKAAANAAWIAYLASTKIGSKVYFAELLQAVMDAGAIEFSGALVGAGVDGNVALGASEVPIAGGSLLTQIAWLVVP